MYTHTVRSIVCLCCGVQPFLGGGEASNCISGKLKLGDETLATLDGHWDGEIFIKERGSGVSHHPAHYTY